MVCLQQVETEDVKEGTNTPSIKTSWNTRCVRRFAQVSVFGLRLSGERANAVSARSKGAARPNDLIVLKKLQGASR
jgi:hypothetical protein